MTKHSNIQLDWRDTIRKGDILLTKKGRPREVLSVRYYGDRLATVRLQKLQRNPMYPAGHTIYTRTDIDYMGYKKSGVRVKKRLTSKP